MTDNIKIVRAALNLAYRKQDLEKPTPSPLYSRAKIALPNLIDRAALVEKVEAMRVDDRTIEDHFDRAEARGYNTAIDAVLRIIKEQG